MWPAEVKHRTVLAQSSRLNVFEGRAAHIRADNAVSQQSQHRASPHRVSVSKKGRGRPADGEL
jgi:hypothetical protein